jgi:hypothetical protein
MYFQKIFNMLRCTFIYMLVMYDVCEECFCDGATWRAEGDHDVGFGLKEKG